MHLFADISSHGFGHLAISAPVLNALAKIDPEMRLTVRSALSPDNLRQRIEPPFALIREASDFGYLMHDATRVDLAASAERYRAAHADWPSRVAAEAALLTRLNPDLVLSNVSYLPLAGAAAAGIPSASLCSLNWADLFQHFFGRNSWASAIHAEMLAAYRSAAAFLRVTPGMAMDELGNQRLIEPIARLGKKHDLGLSGARGVLVAMGGIAHHLDIDRWPRLPGVRWLVTESWQAHHPDAIAFESFGLDFTDLLCSVDAIITKPGYGTFAEATCNGTPVLYQRRTDWPEQDCLIDWLHRHNRALEIDQGTLQRGEVGESLAKLWHQVEPPRPPASGAEQAAAWLKAAGNRNA